MLDPDRTLAPTCSTIQVSVHFTRKSVKPTHQNSFIVHETSFKISRKQIKLKTKFKLSPTLICLPSLAQRLEAGGNC